MSLLESSPSRTRADAAAPVHPSSAGGRHDVDISDEFIETVFGEVGSAISDALLQKLNILTLPISMDVSRGLAASLVGRPQRVARTVLKMSQAPHLDMEFAIAISQRDLDGLLGDGHHDDRRVHGLMLSIAESVQVVLELNTRTGWEVASHTVVESGKAPFHGTAQVGVVRCVLDAEGSREIRIVFTLESLGVLRGLEEHVVVPLRPKLPDLQLPTRGPATIDEGVLEAIPIELTATLSAEPITVGRLACLGVGDAVRMSDDWSHQVCLRAAGRVIARGELVVVGDRWGVLIEQVCGGTV